MTPTGFVAAFLTALVPVVGDAPTSVYWRRRTEPRRRWTAPFSGGAEWDLYVTVQDDGVWWWWAPIWHIDEALFAVAPEDLPAEYVRDFDDQRRQGRLQPFMGPVGERGTPFLVS